MILNGIHNGCHLSQGSVLGPILFVLCINDLPEVVDNKSMIFLFADDTKISRIIDYQADNTQLQKDIDSLIKWSNKRLLNFHPDKCVSMSMGVRTNTMNITWVAIRYIRMWKRYWGIYRLSIKIWYPYKYYDK